MVIEHDGKELGDPCVVMEYIYCYSLVQSCVDDSCLDDDGV